MIRQKWCIVQLLQIKKHQGGTGVWEERAELPASGWAFTGAAGVQKAGTGNKVSEWFGCGYACTGAAAGE